MPAVAVANPQGGVVSAGSATISSPTANTVQIHQTTDKAAINWQSYNVAAQETVHYIQPNSSSISLNRINPNQGPSSIYGSIIANGRVWLINPAGIWFGPSSVVNVAGLVATTANITDHDFMSGKYHFVQLPDFNGAIVNEGIIKTAEAGLVALVGSGVVNDGYIEANLGTVVLASGSEFTMHFSGNDLISFTVDKEIIAPALDKNGNTLKDGVKNTGSIIANGGKILMTAKSASKVLDNAINMQGLAEAKSVGMKNGEIILYGAGDAPVRVSGKLIASGEKAGERGGKVQVLGSKVALTGAAEINAAGDQGGGEILIGGDYQGKNSAIANALFTFIGRDAVINADAITNGHGGKVIVWADDTTRFYGSISAKGGVLGGNGGFVETSGKEYLDINGGSVNASAPLGVTGNWLLDPRNVTISAVTANGAFDGGDPDIFTPTGNNATVDVATINAALDGGTSVTVNTGSTGGQPGNITVSNAILKSAGLTMPTLTLDAAGDINLNNSITATSGGLNVNFLAGDDVTISSTISTNGGTFSNSSDVFTIAATGVINTLGGSFTNSSNSVTWRGDVDTAGGAISSTSQNATTIFDTGSVSSGAGIISFAANADGTGGQDFVMNAGSSITSTNNTADAVKIEVNTAAGGTGSAALRDITVGNGGTITVQTDTGGNITGSDITQATGTLTAGALGNIILSNPQITGNNIGTSGANMQISSGKLSATSGTSGIFITNLGTSAFDLGSINTTGEFRLTSTSSSGITDTGAVIAGTNLRITAGATQDVTLDNAANDYTNVFINSGNNVTLVDANALNIDDSTISGNFNVTTNGAITDSGTLSVAGIATFAAGSDNDITLNTASNDFSTVAITSGNNVTLRDTNALDLGASTVSGNLSLTTSGAVTDSGAISVAGATTIAAGSGNNITFNDAGNNFNSIGISSGNNVTLRDMNALIFNASTISGTLDVTTNGNITQTGNLSVTGDSTFAAGNANDITLDSAGNNFSTVSITSGKDASIRDTNAIVIGTSTLANSFSITADNTITQTGAITAPTLSAKTLNNAGADIILDNASNNADSINLQVRNAADTAFDSGDITYVDADGVNLAQIGTTDNFTLTANGAVTESGPVSVTDLTSLAAGSSNDITLNDAANDFGTMTIASANNVSLSDSNALILDDITLNGSLTVATQGALTQNGLLTLNGNDITVSYSSNGNPITLNTGINSPANNLLLDSGSGGDIIINQDLSLNQLTIANAHDVTNLATLNLNRFLQEAGNITDLGANSLHVTDHASITANTVFGSLYVGSLTLNVQHANLFGTVAGLSGIAAVRQIQYPRPLPNTLFFDGIDMVIPYYSNVINMPENYYANYNVLESLDQLSSLISNEVNALVDNQISADVGSLLPGVAKGLYGEPGVAGSPVFSRATHIAHALQPYNLPVVVASRAVLSGLERIPQMLSSDLLRDIILTLTALGLLMVLIRQIRIENKVRLVKVVEEINGTRYEFLTSIPFKLRTAVNSIMGFASLIRYGKLESLPSTMKKYFDNLLAGSEEVMQFINELTKQTENPLSEKEIDIALRTTSYKLRSSLNSIVGFATLAKQEMHALDDEQKKFMSNIMISAETMLQVLNEFPSFDDNAVRETNVFLTRAVLRELSFNLRTSSNKIIGFAQLVANANEDLISSDQKIYTDNILNGTLELQALVDEVSHLVENKRYVVVSPDYMDSLSFSFRTALNTIKGFAELIYKDQHDRLSDDQLVYIENVIQGSTEMSAYISSNNRSASL